MLCLERGGSRRAAGNQMWTNLYVFTICLVAGALFIAVNKFEPNRLLAYLLMFLLLAVGAAAVARQLDWAPS
jgi:uncharacterized membrane protein YbjE (DUF340 family)